MRRERCAIVPGDALLDVERPSLVVVAVLHAFSQPGDDLACDIVHVPQGLIGDLNVPSRPIFAIGDPVVEAFDHGEIALVHDQGFGARERQGHAVEDELAFRGRRRGVLRRGCSRCRFRATRSGIIDHRGVEDFGRWGWRLGAAAAPCNYRQNDNGSQDVVDYPMGFHLSSKMRTVLVCFTDHR